MGARISVQPEAFDTQAYISAMLDCGDIRREAYISFGFMTNLFSLI